MHTPIINRNLVGLIAVLVLLLKLSQGPLTFENLIRALIYMVAILIIYYIVEWILMQFMGKK